MKILVIGASGFLGTELTKRLIERGHTVYALSRHPLEAGAKLIPVLGDILQPGLGLETSLEVDAVHHLAAIHHLGEDKDGMIWKTNFEGTKNVADFCETRGFHLLFTSTAYTQGRNIYEHSKKCCEEMLVSRFTNKRLKGLTIYKPSIIMGNDQHFYPGHFSQFSVALIRFVEKAGLVKEKVEETLRLPSLEVGIRFKGNPEGFLNLVPIDQVVAGMLELGENHTYWLTNPEPPKLSTVAEWLSEFMHVRFSIEPEFKPSVLDSAFARIARAFSWYAEGDSFASDLKQCPPITKEFIHATIRRALAERR
jgi:nucleoside-diphosphate-sugar epimerase